MQSIGSFGSNSGLNTRFISDWDLAEPISVIRYTIGESVKLVLKESIRMDGNDSNNLTVSEDKQFIRGKIKFSTSSKWYRKIIGRCKLPEYKIKNSG